jgi:excinuclease ABC subunit C
LDIKEKIKAMPDMPGVYLFRNKESEIIYIGKAASIRKRLRTHFPGSFSMRNSPKQDALKEDVFAIDCFKTPDESTALLLEAALIKRYRPKFNVLLKDDKSYPRLKLSVDEEYPRLSITRKVRPDGSLYFGPYTNPKLLRAAVKFLRRVFPLRVCRKMPTQKDAKGCLYRHIGQCIGPCVSADKDNYMAVVDELRLFLEGRQEQLIESLKQKMVTAAERKDYEQAARIRDRIGALSCLSTDSRRNQKTITHDLSDTTARETEQLGELRKLLGLRHTPDIIEAFDVSNTSGKEATGSMVYFKKARPHKQAYMHFRIKTVDVVDDYRMMREIISRRYNKLLAEKTRLPDLIIIDGGKGHLAAAKSQLRALRIIDIPVIGIAKNPDRLYTHEKKEPLLLGRFQKALLLCQRIRDEAHRFAISYHRLLRSKKTKLSELDSIRGIGPRRKSELIKYFGSLDKVKQAGINQLKKVDFIDEKEAKAIYNHFRL